MKIALKNPHAGWKTEEVFEAPTEERNVLCGRDHKGNPDYRTLTVVQFEGDLYHVVDPTKADPYIELGLTLRACNGHECTILIYGAYAAWTSQYCDKCNQRICAGIREEERKRRQRRTPEMIAFQKHLEEQRKNG